MFLSFQSTAAITCIRLVSSVEYMVAAGNVHGEVSIFQIQKELPAELSHEIAATLIEPKPIERYTIADACRGAITCVEWSKNGMKLFSGDSHGVVVLTELDFGQHICKSMEVVNEKFGIIQMQFCSPWLLVSTLYRAIVCKPNETNEWKVSQIGRTDRKVLNEFGATFTPTDVDHRKPPSIVCARPGFRFWLADVDGNVSHTFLLKDSVSDVCSIFEVPLLNPVDGKPINMKDAYFGRCHYYMGKYIVTYCESTVFIVNLDKLKVLATIRRLRNIQYLSVYGNEIFIVEGGRSIVRISIVPECSGGSRQYVPSNNDNLLNDTNIEIQEEIVTQADECFELPPIENIRLDIPLACRLGEHNLLKEDKLLLEHSRKLEVFEKINTLDYDESILFHTGTRKKKKTSVHSSSSDETRIERVVEIGRQAELLNNGKSNGFSKIETYIIKSPVTNGSFSEFTTKPCLMQASFCDGISNGHNVITMNNESKPVEMKLSENLVEQLIETPKRASPKMHQYERLNLKQIDKTIASNQKISPEMNCSTFKPLELGYPAYPVRLEANGFGHSNGPRIIDGLSVETPLTEIPLTSDDEDDSDDSDAIDSLDAIKQCANNLTPMNSPPKRSTKTSDVDRKILKYPANLANLPKLWDIKIEQCDENQYNGDANSSACSTREGSDSEWVFL